MQMSMYSTFITVRRANIDYVSKMNALTKNIAYYKIKSIPQPGLIRMKGFYI